MKCNDYYRFDDQRRGCSVLRPDTPQPWINYLSNGTMHAFVSQAGGGFAWWKSPLAYRITRYRQYNLPLDSPGFYVYIRHRDGTFWSPTSRPCSVKPEKWRAEHLPGKTRFIAEHHGVRAVLTYFVAPDFNVLVWSLDLSSADGREHSLDVYSYCEFSQPRWDSEISGGYYTRLMLETRLNTEIQSLDYLHHDQTYPKGWKQPLFFLAGTEQICSCCGSRNAFMGNYGDESEPAALYRPELGNETISCGEACGALQSRIVLLAKGSRKLAFFLGVSEDAITDMEQCKARQKKILTAIRQDYAEQENKLDQIWQRRFGIFQCAVPDPDAERQINTWNVINSQVTAHFSRSVNVEAPGIRVVGFRDSCQDMISAAIRDPDHARNMLIFLLSHQFEDGHCVHTCHKDEWGEPDLRLCSDNHLWLPLSVYALVSETGDMDFLETEVPYLESEHRASVWKHLMQAVDFSEKHIGQHSLLLTLHSDWNDIIGRFNREGRGESVFVSQQYAYALTLLLEMAKAAGKDEDAGLLGAALTRMRNALNACAWDGSWWRRGFDDDGIPVGSESCSCGKIFLNPQSWSVLAGTGTAEQNRKALDAAYERLETPIGLQLMTPGFAGWDQEPGETPLGYLPGCGENGAIFCHANTWAIIAEALMGRGDRAWEYFRQLIPHNVIRKIGVETYRAEPYAWCSNIIGPDNPQFGWGNVNQITGTAPWMDVAATQYLLGVRPTMKGLLIDPVLPADWNTVTVDRIFRGCRLHIQIIRSADLPRLTADGVEMSLTNGKAVIPPDFCHSHSSAEILYRFV